MAFFSQRFRPKIGIFCRLGLVVQALMGVGFADESPPVQGKSNVQVEPIDKTLAGGREGHGGNPLQAEFLFLGIEGFNLASSRYFRDFKFKPEEWNKIRASIVGVPEDPATTLKLKARIQIVEGPLLDKYGGLVTASVVADPECESPESPCHGRKLIKLDGKMFKRDQTRVPVGILRTWVLHEFVQAAGIVDDQWQSSLKVSLDEPEGETTIKESTVHLHTYCYSPVIVNESAVERREKLINSCREKSDDLQIDLGDYLAERMGPGFTAFDLSRSLADSYISRKLMFPVKDKSPDLELDEDAPVVFRDGVYVSSVAKFKTRARWPLITQHKKIEIEEAKWPQVDKSKFTNLSDYLNALNLAFDDALKLAEDECANMIQENIKKLNKNGRRRLVFQSCAYGKVVVSINKEEPSVRRLNFPANLFFTVEGE